MNERLLKTVTGISSILNLFPCYPYSHQIGTTTTSLYLPVQRRVPLIYVPLERAPLPRCMVRRLNSGDGTRKIVQPSIIDDENPVQVIELVLEGARAFTAKGSANWYPMNVLGRNLHDLVAQELDFEARGQHQAVLQPGHHAVLSGSREHGRIDEHERRGDRRGGPFQHHHPGVDSVLQGGCRVAPYARREEVGDRSDGRTEGPDGGGGPAQDRVRIGDRPAEGTVARRRC
mmetsp:Transcript_15333/g.30567  ORF Transcript_15333/g.30567 Transcript_15333/m.30567 type:complete len:231 (-) Transcript_15333:42-734(-)